MKTIHRKNLNLFPSINGIEYEFMAAESTIAKRCNADLCVKVLSSRLEGKTDLHGNPYKERSYYFKKK